MTYIEFKYFTHDINNDDDSHNTRLIRIINITGVDMIDFINNAKLNTYFTVTIIGKYYDEWGYISECIILEPLVYNTRASSTILIVEVHINTLDALKEIFNYFFNNILIDYELPTDILICCVNNRNCKCYLPVDLFNVLMTNGHYNRIFHEWYGSTQRIDIINKYTT